MTRRTRQPNRHNQRGQSVVEFALLLPLLLFLLVGVVFFTMAFNIQQVLNNAAREGARQWAMNPPLGNPGCTTPCDPNTGTNNFKTNIMPLVRQYVTDNGYDGAGVSFQVSQTSDQVTVSLSYPYSLPADGVNFVTINLSASCTFKRG
jgi:type II secretory pathway pseudopilin PulG